MKTCINKNKKKYLYNFVLFNNLIQCVPINSTNDNDVVIPMKVSKTKKKNSISSSSSNNNFYQPTNTFISTTTNNTNSSMIHNNTPNNEKNDNVYEDEFKNLQYDVVYSVNDNKR